jgi:trimeric autotransporter adhesin
MTTKVSASVLANTAVSAGTYGGAATIPVHTVDAQGRITYAANVAVAISSSAVSGLATSATTDTTNASNISSGTLPSARLSGSYTGITGVGTLSAGSIPTSLITGLAASATTDTTNASNITSGTLGTSRLSGSYTGITGVGTLAAGSIPSTLITGLPSNIVGFQANGTIIEYAQTITSNYTITTNTNALSAGPITVNTGVTLTVPDGSRWVII